MLELISVVNKAYLGPFAVLVHSVRQHTQAPLRWWVIEDELPESFKDALSADLPVNWLKPPRDRSDKIKLPPRFVGQVYHHLTLGELLPDVERAIFLDADMLVQRDLAELWKLGTPERTVRAVRDQAIPCAGHGRGVPDAAESGVPLNAPIFNCGVLDLNLQRWRETGLTDRLFDYLQRRGEKLKLAAQEAFNALLWNEWDEIPMAWNVTAGLAGRKFCPIAAPSEPAILHFSGYIKPWEHRSGSRFQQAYEQASREQHYVPAATPRRWSAVSIYDRWVRPWSYPFERIAWERCWF